MQLQRTTPDQATRDHAWSPVELLQKVDNDIDLASELIVMFIEDAPEMSYDIAMAARAGAPGRLASTAHAYRGSAAAIGAIAVAKAVGQLEEAGRAGRSDVERELAYFKQLENRLMEQLRAATNDS